MNEASQQKSDSSTAGCTKKNPIKQDGIELFTVLIAYHLVLTNSFG